MSEPRLERLPIRPPFPPMEAALVRALPTEAGVQLEPKWDGFRVLAFRDGDEVALQSKAGQPLARYFPELVEAVRAIAADRFVLDGEILLPQGSATSFELLLQRIHPAASRIARLAKETPTLIVAFDLLVDAEGRLLTDAPLSTRRDALERFLARHAQGNPLVRLSPRTTDRAVAERWLVEHPAGIDGVVAKRLDEPYRSGERAMRKVKQQRTADCVVGGFRWAKGGTGTSVGSLLLGLYGDDGRLHHVGFCSGLKGPERKRLATLFQPLVEPPGFDGASPGGPSRWQRPSGDGDGAGGEERSWQPLRPEIVVEVGFDHVSGGHFRHGTSLVRFRPDKAPRQCTMEQLELPRGDGSGPPSHGAIAAEADLAAWLDRG